MVAAHDRLRLAQEQSRWFMMIYFLLRVPKRSMGQRLLVTEGPINAGLCKVCLQVDDMRPRQTSAWCGRKTIYSTYVALDVRLIPLVPLLFRICSVFGCAPPSSMKTDWLLSGVSVPERFH